MISTAKTERVGEGIQLNLNTVITVSYSSLGLLSACPRKFSLYKVYPDGVYKRDESPALSQGKAVGLGYARWLECILNPSCINPLEEALLETWRGYYPPLEDNVRSMTKAAVIVQKLAEATEDSMYGWQLAKINGKPCVETSFCIRLTKPTATTPATYFVGFLDAILEHVDTYALLPLELKTSSLTAHLRENFLNSTQGNGYGIILDTVRKLRGEPVGINYDIQYLVAQVHRTKAEAYNPTIHSFTFTKTILDRLEWLMDLKMSQQRLQAYIDVHMFPRNGSNCLSWNRLCAYSGICNLTSIQEPRWEQLADAPPDIVEYDFYFDLQELITDAVALASSL